MKSKSSCRVVKSLQGLGALRRLGAKAPWSRLKTQSHLQSGHIHGPRSVPSCTELELQYSACSPGRRHQRHRWLVGPIHHMYTQMLQLCQLTIFD